MWGNGGADDQCPQDVPAPNQRFCEHWTVSYYHCAPFWLMKETNYYCFDAGS